MAYVTYENYSFVIRENTGSTRILAGLIIGGTDNSSDESFSFILTAISEYVTNHAMYEAINPLWVGYNNYSSEPTGAIVGYVCVWEAYTAGNDDSLSNAFNKLRSAVLQYRRAAVTAYMGGGIAYAKDYFTNCLPQTQQLDTPTNLTATNITSNSALVSWAQNANASNFKIEYKINGDTSWTQTTSD